jgi:hypothetical protein
MNLFIWFKDIGRDHTDLIPLLVMFIQLLNLIAFLLTIVLTLSSSSHDYYCVFSRLTPSIGFLATQQCFAFGAHFISPPAHVTAAPLPTLSRVPRSFHFAVRSFVPLTGKAVFVVGSAHLRSAYGKGFASPASQSPCLLCCHFAVACLPPQSRLPRPLRATPLCSSPLAFRLARWSRLSCGRVMLFAFSRRSGKKSRHALAASRLLAPMLC